MATEVLQVLADGQLQSSITPLCAINSKEAAEVHQIIIVNKDNAQRQISIYISVRQSNNEYGTNRLITPNGLLLDAGDLCYVLDTPIQLSDGDSFNGICDVADVVDYVVTGRIIK